LAVRFGELLVERGGVAAPGDLGAAAESGVVTRPRRSRALDELEAPGLVTRTKAEVRLTTAGWTFFASPVQVGAGERLDAALGIWPHEHRSFLELASSVIVARRHLGEACTEDWLGFIAIGASKGGKSAMADWLCRVFGLERVEHTAYLQTETPGSVSGRREQGKEGWEWVASPYGDLPFVVFEEFDKSDEKMRRAVLRYFQGNTRVSIEGATRTLRPTPMLAANPPRAGEDRYRILPDEYRRRSIVLNLDTAHPELEARLRHFYETTRLPLVDLDTLAPRGRLSEVARRVLELIPTVLSEEGNLFFPNVRALEHATLGRAALLGPGADEVIAAYATGISYLSCASTISGLVDDGWQLSLEGIRNVIGPDTDIAVLEDAVAREHQARTQRRNRQVTASRAKTSLELEVLGRRGELVERIAQALRDIHGGKVRGHAVEAGRLRDQLKRLHSRAKQVEAADSIEDLEHAAMEPLRRAQHLRDVIVQEKKDDEREAAQRKEQERQAKQSRALMPRPPSRAEVRRRQRAPLIAQLNQIQVVARELEKRWRRKKTRPEENPFRDLVSLRVLGEQILEYEANPHVQPSHADTALEVSEAVLGVAAAVFGQRHHRKRVAPQPGRWSSPWDDRVRFPGSPTSCPHLAKWGENSRLVLAPVLKVLHAREDLLRSELGQPPRRGRPNVEWQSEPAQHIPAIA
jgi:hypothetical protein